jgi:hypothetical protein
VVVSVVAKVQIQIAAIISQKFKKTNLFATHLHVAPLVQLDRMSAYGADGRRFESCTGCLFCRSGVFDQSATHSMVALWICWARFYFQLFNFFQLFKFSSVDERQQR